MDMQAFERVYLRTLRQIYDAKKQILASMQAISEPSVDVGLVAVLGDIEAQASRQLERLDGIFAVLYQEPRGEASWVTTALLREALEASEDAGAEGCAAALLALKRYELTLYETLLRWSERCDLYEALPAIRRCLAEEMLQASVLAGYAFETRLEAEASLAVVDRRALH